MFGKIKYSYIPKEKTTDAILSSLSYALKSTGGYDYILIDNNAQGIRLYPDEIKNKIIKTDKENLKSTVEKYINEDFEIIILNGFDLELDEIREDFCQMIEESDILLCINKIVDSIKETNVSIVIDPSVTTLDDKEWEITKQEMLDNLEDAVKSSKDKKNNSKDEWSNLIKLFGLDSIYDEDVEDFFIEEDDLSGKDIDVKEQYCHSKGDLELYISLTANDSIIIDTGDKMTVISKEQTSFLLDTLNKLIK